MTKHMTIEMLRAAYPEVAAIAAPRAGDLNERKLSVSGIEGVQARVLSVIGEPFLLAVAHEIVMAADSERSTAFRGICAVLASLASGAAENFATDEDNAGSALRSYAALCIAGFLERSNAGQGVEVERRDTSFEIGIGQ